MARDWRDRLMQRLNHNDLDLDLNDERVLKEMSIFSEKCDISEEITRIESHLGQLTQTIQKKGSIGRQVEFLLQEGKAENLTQFALNQLLPAAQKKLWKEKSRWKN